MLTHICMSLILGWKFPDCCYLLMNFLTGSQSKMTSICPVLGQRYPKVVVGFCPTNFKSLTGKQIPISYIGTPPYILGNDASRGTDVLVTNLLAKRYSFVPILRPTPQYLIMQFENGTKYGKKYQVWTSLVKLACYSWEEVEIVAYFVMVFFCSILLNNEREIL